MLASNTRRAIAGFTLIEVVVAVAVMALIGLTFLTVITNFFVTINRNNQLTEMTINSQNLLRSTVENIRFGDGVRQTNTLTDPYAPSGGWNTNNTNFVIILAVPAVDASKNYIIDPNTGIPYMNELVYYKNGTTLMRRTLTDPNAIGNSLVQSCPPANATPSCPADLELAPNVSSMVFTLYDQNGAVTSTASLARSVKINLTMQRNPGTTPLTVSNSIRVTLRNRF